MNRAPALKSPHELHRYCFIDDGEERRKREIDALKNCRIGTEYSKNPRLCGCETEEGFYEIFH